MCWPSPLAPVSMSREDGPSVEPVQVFIRIRPDIFQTIRDRPGDASKCLFQLDDTTIRVTPPSVDGAQGLRKSVPAVDDKIFTFDAIFSPESNQEPVYDRVSQHVRATIQGYNTTIFALGCTGSGKTFTMTGNSQDPGIIPRAISEIFSIIEKTAAHEKDVFFYVRLSFVELYNNNFRNLLEFASKELELTKGDDNNRPTSPTMIHPNLGSSLRSDKIEVRESQSAGVFLAGHNLRIPVTTAQEAFRLINRGNKNRATGSTQCNDVSSRSHAILTLHVESRIGSNLQTQNSAELRLGKIHLVDLAGSERVAMSGAEGETLVETQNINLSLTALGDVLSALSRNAAIMLNNNVTNKSSTPRSPGGNSPTLVPVPYRNSKLTHLLKDSLGGNSKTIMITTVHSLSEYYHQTLISLMYASRAKKVRNRSLVNRDVIGDSGIHAVTSEIERLKNRLDARSDEFDKLKNLQMKDAKENAHLKHRLQQLHEANIREKAELESQMSHVIHSQAGELASQKEKLASLETALQEELARSQNKIAEQEKEINWLKRALDETSQAVAQPAEQIERVQRVADAWQSQAKCAQEELESANRQIHELRIANVSLTTNLNEAVTTIRHLKEELTQSKHLDEENRSNLARLREENNTNLRELQRAKETLSNSRNEISSLNLRNEDLLAKISYLENEILKYQKDLSKIRTDYNTLRKENGETTDSLQKKYDILQNRFSETISDLETKMKVTISQSSMRVRDLEEENEMIQEKYQAVLEEMEVMKTRISNIHLDVEMVTNERDNTIHKLNEALNVNENVKSELIEKLKKSENHVDILNKDLTALKEEYDKLNQMHHQLKLRHEDILEIHKEELNTSQFEHEKLIEEIKKEHRKQIQDLHQHSTSEIVKFRDEISSTVSSQQDLVRKKHQRELEEMQKTKDLEYSGRLKIAIEDLTRDHEDKLQMALENQKLGLEIDRDRLIAIAIEEAHLEWKVEVNQMLQENECAYREMTAQLEQSHSDTIRSLNLRHESIIGELMNQHSQELKNRIEVHQIELQQRQSEEEMRFQELRAQQFEIIKETEESYQRRLSSLEEDIEKMKRAQIQEIESLKDENRRTVNDIKSRFKKQWNHLLDENRKSMEELKATLQMTHQEDILKMAEEHERQFEQINEKHKTHLEFEISNLHQTYRKEIESLNVVHQLEMQEAIRVVISEQVELNKTVLDKRMMDVNAEWEMKCSLELKKVNESFQKEKDSEIHRLRQDQIKEISELKMEWERQKQILREEDAKQTSKVLEDAECSYTLRLAENLKSLRNEIDRQHQEDLKQLKEILSQDYDSTIQKLVMKNQLERDILKIEVKDKVTEELSEKHVEEKEQLRLQYEEIALKLKKEHQESIDRMTQIYESKRQQEKIENEEQIRQIQKRCNELECENQQLLDKYRIDLNELTTKLNQQSVEIKQLGAARVEDKKLYDLEIKRLIFERDEIMDQLKAQEDHHELEIEALRVGFESRLTEKLKDADRSTLSRIEEVSTELNELHDQRIQKMVEDQQCLLQSMNLKYEREIRDAVTKAQNEAEKRLVAEVSVFEKSLNDQFDEKIRLLDENHNKELLKLKEEYETSVRNIEEFHSKISEERLDSMRKNLTESQVSELQQLRFELESLSQQKLTGMRHDLEVQYELEKTQLKDEHFHQLSVLEVTHNSQIQLLKEQHLDEINHITKLEQDEKGRMIHQHLAEVKRLKDEKDQEMSEKDKMTQTYLRAKEEYETRLRTFEMQWNDEKKSLFQEQSAISEAFEQFKMEHEQIVETIKKEQTDTIQVLHTEFADKFARRIAEHEVERKCLEEKYILELERRKTQYEVTIEENQRSYDQVVKDLRMELEKINEAKRVMEQDYNKKFSDLRNESQLSLKYFEDLNQKLQESHAALLLQIQSKHAHELFLQKQELESNFHSMLELLERKHAAFTSSLLHDHRDEFSKFVADRDDTVKNLQERIFKMDEDARGFLSSSLNDQLQRVMNHHQKEFDLIRAATRDHFQREVTSRNERIQSLELDLAQEHESKLFYEEKERKNQLLLKEKEIFLAQELDRLKSLFESQILEIQQRHSLEVSNFQSTIHEMERSHSQSIEQLTSQITLLKEFTNTKDSEIEKLKMDYQDEISKVKKLYEDRIENLLQSHQNQLLESESIKDSFRAEFLRLKDIHSDEITSLQIQLNRTITELQHQIDSMSQDLSEKDATILELKNLVEDDKYYLNQYESKILKINQENQRQFDELQQKFHETVSNLETKKNEDIRALQSRLAESFAHLDQLKKQYDHKTTTEVQLESQIAQLSATYENRILHLQHSLEENSRLLLQEKECTEVLKSQRITTSELEKKYQSELNSSQLILISLKDENTKLIEKLAHKEKLLDFEKSLSKNTLEKLEATRQEHQSHIQKLREELQEQYTTQLQQELQKLSLVINSQNNFSASLPRIEEMQGKFLAMIENLPDTIHNQIERAKIIPVDPESESSKFSTLPHKETDGPQIVTWKNLREKNPQFPVNLSHYRSHSADIQFEISDHQRVAGKNQTSGRRNSTDDFINAILDGDSQGIRLIVRSQGESLQSEYWKDICTSILPLHRAISGLHLHGNGTILIHTLETLIQLGANVHAQDSTGNTALHKTIQVCPSIFVSQVAEMLLQKGLSPTITNNVGISVLQLECTRIRSATPSLVKLFLDYGAEVNTPFQMNGVEGITALYALLYTVAHASDRKPIHDTILDQSSSTNSKLKNSGSKSWVKTLKILLNAGARWNPGIQLSKGETELYLLLSSFPPPREDLHMYRAILQSCLRSSTDMNPLLEDESGKSALFVFCEQLSHLPAGPFPEVSAIVKMILDHIPGGGIGGADRTGRTIFDLIDERVGYSCLQSVRELLSDAGIRNLNSKVEKQPSWRREV